MRAAQPSGPRHPLPMKSNPNRDATSGLLPLQAALIDWLVDPERAGSQNEWARQRGISESLPSKWKREDPFFQSELQRRLVDEQLSPAAMAKSLDAIKAKAEKGDVQAFNALLTYLKWVDPEPDTQAERPIESYSDEELAAALEEAALLRASPADEPHLSATSGHGSRSPVPTLEVLASATSTDGPAASPERTSPLPRSQ